nr:DNA alkylation repair protein [Clostridium chromiireducens]
MADALKDIYSKEFLESFARKVQSAYNIFDEKGFVDDVIDNKWQELKLKERIRRISEILGRYLPEKYGDALEVLFSIDEECIGFPYLFFPDFVVVYGSKFEHWELSMKAIERFTMRSSSEFAVRPFIISDPEFMMQQMLKWSKSDNEHVRRLASEGCRPRLPWGEGIPVFKKDPKPVISVLEQLKEDQSVYVRKSVANNLNDISKDNPETIIEIIKKWKGKNSYTDWILRHGARTLIRKADPEVMRLFGYGDVQGNSIVTSANLSVDLKTVKIGENSTFTYEVYVRNGERVHIRIEYGIDFVKARGNVSRKLFLLSDKTVLGGEHITGARTHSWKNLTTRRHYEGEHKIVLLVNGCEVSNTIINLEK